MEVFEFSVEGGRRTRFARKKLKKAVGRLELANSSCAKSYSDKNTIYLRRIEKEIIVKY